MRRYLAIILVVFSMGATRVSASRVSALAPHIVAFRVMPSIVQRGQAVTMVWDIRGADSVSIGSAPERNPRGNLHRMVLLPGAGSLTFYPEESTAYVLECRTGRGDLCMAASTSVEVR